MTAATVTPLSVAERRAKLAGLGPRPDREAVVQAKQALAKIDAELVENKENASVANLPPADATIVKESQGAEEEKVEQHKKVIMLDELHQSYQVVLEHEEARVAPPEDPSVAEAARIVQDAIDNDRENLDLSKHFMSRLPESFSRIVLLVSLDLSYNQLKFLPNSVCGLVNLESLRVHSNQLYALPDSLGQMTKLKYLDVSSNALTRLPESLGSCSSLLELNANFNQLNCVSSNFGLMLLNLEKLELQLNKLSSIPASLCELKSLKYLDLHMNKLRGLPGSIGNLSALEYLDVSSNFNDLQVLPESTGELRSLTHFDLSFNQVRELPDSIGRLEKLTTLKVEGNPLVTPPPEVVEHSHDAIMEFLRQRHMTTTDGDLLISPSNTNYSPRGKSQYNPWIPAWAANSVFGVCLESLSGNVGILLGGGTGSFLGFQQYQQDQLLEQQL